MLADSLEDEGDSQVQRLERMKSEYRFLCCHTAGCSPVEPRL